MINAYLRHQKEKNSDTSYLRKSIVMEWRVKRRTTISSVRGDTRPTVIKLIGRMIPPVILFCSAIRTRPILVTIIISLVGRYTRPLIWAWRKLTSMIARGNSVWETTRITLVIIHFMMQSVRISFLSSYSRSMLNQTYHYNSQKKHSLVFNALNPIVMYQESQNKPGNNNHLAPPLFHHERYFLSNRVNRHRPALLTST